MADDTPDEINELTGYDPIQQINWFNENGRKYRETWQALIRLRTEIPWVGKYVGKVLFLVGIRCKAYGVVCPMDIEYITLLERRAKERLRSGDLFDPVVKTIEIGEKYNTE